MVNLDTLWTLMIVTVASAAPDSVLFSSVAEMSKLAKLELTAIAKLKELRNLINNDNSNLINNDNSLRETDEFNLIYKEVNQFFENLPPTSELEGAGNGKLSCILSFLFQCFDARLISPPGDIQAERVPVQ